MQEALETLKQINGFENYFVSDCGNVYHLNGESRKKLAQWHAGRGYLKVALFKNGQQKKEYIHRLVVEAFIGEIPAGMQVNHIDEDKENNHASNLEIVTPKQNINHGTRNKKVSEALKRYWLQKKGGLL